MFASTSFVTPTGENLSSCGYCKSKHSSASYGIWAYRLTCEDYQRFINRGWRRSGVYLYKPNQRDSCCAAYAIRLDVSQFQFEKSQKKVIKKVNKLLHNGRINSEQKRNTSSKTKSNSGQSPIDTLEQMIKDAESDTDKSFTIELKQSCNDKDTFELYKKYQTVIHHDDPEEITEHQFTRFLVDSPLEFEEKQGWSVPGLGSFHQKYYYDGQLVAVAVLDILPQCVSSVYLMYDPDFNEWGLGKYSALREIMFTHLLSRDNPSLKYYCMGLYIHTCVKMRYKGQYKPSELLEPETNNWYPLANYAPHFDTHRYVSLSSDGSTLALDLMADKSRPAPGVRDWEELTIDDIKEVAVSYARRLVYANCIDDEYLKDLVYQYVATVGPSLAKSMIVALIR